MQFEIITLSRPGRRNHNEDVHGIWHDEDHLIALVADGAGGHGGGDVAAWTVRHSILTRFSAHPGIEEQDLRLLLEQANEAVVQRQRQQTTLASMRSTVVIAAIDMDKETMVWVHCGDSRAYLFRAGAIQAQTTDHSLVQQLVDNGLLDEEGARLHPHHNVLLTALGAADEMPDIAISPRMRLQPGDVLLLCSDGVWGTLGNQQLLATLEQASSPDQWAKTIDAQIKAKALSDQDNYTLLTLWAKPDESDESNDSNEREARQSKEPIEPKEQSEPSEPCKPTEQGQRSEQPKQSQAQEIDEKGLLADPSDGFLPTQSEGDPSEES